MFKNSNRVIFRIFIHENTHNELNIQIEQGWAFPNILNNFPFSPSGKRSLIESNRHFLEMWSNAAVKSTNNR